MTEVKELSQEEQKVMEETARINKEREKLRQKVTTDFVNMCAEFLYLRLQEEMAKYEEQRNFLKGDSDVAK